MNYNQNETGIGLIEVPGEISLNIPITGCPIHCPECHSKHNWDPNSGIQLTEDRLLKLIHDYSNKVSVITFMGGDWDFDELEDLIDIIKSNSHFKVCLYSGLNKYDDIPSSILNQLDYLKIGPYKSEFGGLDSKTTNQRFYLNNNGKLVNLTSKFQR